MRIFGCKAFVLDKRRANGKLSSKAIPCVLVGYSTQSKAYRLWSPEQRKIIVSRDVKFFDEPGLIESYKEFTILEEKTKNEVVIDHHDNEETDFEIEQKSEKEQLTQKDNIIDTPNRPEMYKMRTTYPNNSPREEEEDQKFSIRG